MSGDTYVKVKGVMVHKRKDAVLVLFDYLIEDGEPAWVSFSLMHSADEREFSWDMVTELVEFRIFEWKARELGLD